MFGTSTPSLWSLKNCLSSHYFQATLLAVITVSVVVGVNRSRHKLSTETGFRQSEITTPTAGKTRDDKERIETELVTIQSTGFEPTEIKRPAGKFLLEVDNRSEKEVDLRFDRPDGGRASEVRMRLTGPEWSRALDLPPGEYILSEANHPNWICRVKLLPAETKQ